MINCLFADLDYAERQWLVLWILMFLTALGSVLYFFVSRSYDNAAIDLTKRALKGKRKIIKIAIKIGIVLVLLIIMLQYFEIQKLDRSTKITPKQKIVVIEIDDYWNMEKGIEYLSEQEYSMEAYIAVSDLLDKYNYTATLGVSPYLYIEQTRETLPLRNDLEMVEYLKNLKKKGYEVGMHGHSHCRNPKDCPGYEEVYLLLLQGKNELEELFGEKITTYFPPGNEWTTEQYENVKRTGFIVIPNTHVDSPYLDENVLITPRAYDVVKKWDWYGGNFIHYEYEDWITEYEKNDFFVLQLHCNTFDSKQKLDDLEKFLKQLKNDDVMVLTYRQAYEELVNDQQ
ncbi:MAG: DUF2334 domain-containing protein [Candidatus Micrarchaeota archaeon]